MLYFEKKLKRKGCDCVIGIDEAGRGPLAGPVVAASVLLKTYSFKNRIDDSKKLTCRSREKAFLEIITKSFFGVGVISQEVIDRVNILEATRMAMERSLDSLTAKIDYPRDKRIHVIVDGNVKLNTALAYTNIIKGDARSKSIAAASIVAKVIRDRIMCIYDSIYPQYGFSEHKGYPTCAHKAVLKEIGPSLIHRKTFNSV